MSLMKVTFLVALLVVGLVAQGDDYTRFCLNDPQDIVEEAVAQLGYSDWDSSRLNAEVAKIILREHGGFPVTISPPPEGETYDWPGMEAGTSDIAFEVWDEGREDEIDPLVRARVTSRIGSLGVLGLNGWFMQSFAMDDYEPYASWRPLTRCSDTAVFRSSGTVNSTKGEIAGTSPGWILTQGTLQVIENNHLCLEWVEYNTSDEYLEVWETKTEAHEPFMFTYWEPTAIFERYKFIEGPNAYDYKLDRIALPRWSADCQARFNNGYDCDFQPSVIGKYMTEREDLEPELAFFYEQFTLSNGDQEGMLAYLNYVEGADYFEAACEWVKDNRDTWRTWFWECENDCFGNGVCNNGTCACLTGWEGEFCGTKISNKYFYCTNGSTFIDETGLVEAPDLRHNPEFIPYDLVCDEIIDCDNWMDEEQDCSPSLYSGTIAFSTIIAFSIFLVLISLIFIWVKRERGRIRAAGVEFLTQLHLGVAWGMSSCFLFMGKNSDAKCGMMPWFIAVPSALVIGSLVAKQYKVWKVLSHKGFQVIRITNQQLFAITGGIVAVDLIVLIVWSAYDIPHLGLREVDSNEHPLCETDQFLAFFIVLVAYKFAIIFVSAVLAWKSRGLPSAYSEAKHIGFALYNGVFLMIIFIPIILATNDEAFLTWILIIIGLWLWFFSIYLIVVGFILAGLWKDRHLDDSEKNALPDVSKSSRSGGTSKSTTPM